MERFFKPECQIQSKRCKTCKYNLACKNTLFINFNFDNIVQKMGTIADKIESFFNENIGNFEYEAGQDEVYDIIEGMKNKKNIYKQYIEKNYEEVCYEVKQTISKAKENIKLNNCVGLFEQNLLDEIVYKTEKKLNEMNLKYKIFFLDSKGIFAIPYKENVNLLYSEKPMFLRDIKNVEKYKHLKNNEQYFSYVGGLNNCDSLMIVVEEYENYMNEVDNDWGGGLDEAYSEITNELQNMNYIDLDDICERSDNNSYYDKWEEEFWENEEITYEIDKSWKKYIENKKKQIRGFITQGMKKINLNKTLVWC